MSNYLSAIVARSNQNNNISLMPSLPAMSAANAGMVQDFADENFFMDSSQKENGKSSLIPSSPERAEFSKKSPWDKSDENKPGKDFSTNELNHKNKVQIQPDIPQQIMPDTFKENIEAKDSNIINITPYITRHVERMIVNEKSRNDETDFMSANAKNYAGLTKKSEDYPDNLSVKNNQSNASEAKDGSFLNPQESAERMNDSRKRESNNNHKLKNEKSSLVKNTIGTPILPRINPVQAVADVSSQTRNRKNPPTPKLVIGKITVEILPPAAQPATKIITRVVQSPSTENYSKMNRLNFGLGQL